jgi:outer membrane protein
MKTYSRYYAFGIVAIMALMSGQGLMAQNQKTGYIDSEYILSKLPDYSGIEQRLATIVQGWATEIDALDKEIEELKRDLQAKEILYTEQVRKDKQEEIDRKITDKDRLVQSKYGPDGEYYKTQETLLEPIQQKIMLAVRTVAERGNYDFVFDRSGDFLFLYTKPQWNLSNDVLKELGIEVDTTTGQ